MESRPGREEKSEFRRWEFAGFQGVSLAKPANTITLVPAELAGLDHSPPPNTVSRPCDGKAPYILGQMAGLRHQGNQV
jgi:hypothetical protein